MADAGHYITMPVEMIRRLRAEGAEQDRSVSWLVRKYINDAWKAADLAAAGAQEGEQT